MQHFRVHSISPELFERFSFNFTQMFILVRRCAEHMIQLPRPKVNVTYPLHIWWTLWSIFFNYHPNVPLSVAMFRSRTYDLATQTQVHTSKAWDFTLQFVSAPYLLNSFSLIFTQMFLSVRWCAGLITHLRRLKVKVILQGHAINPWIMCLNLPNHLLDFY